MSDNKLNAFIGEAINQARDRVKDRKRWQHLESLDELDRILKNGVKLRPPKDFAEDALYAYKSYLLDRVERGLEALSFQMFILAHCSNSLWGDEAP